MRKTMGIAGAILLGALGSSRVDACSMCHCGDPMFSLVGSQIFQPGAWRLGLDAERYSKDQVSQDDPTSREKEVEQRLTLSAAYTPTERLTLAARLPLAHRQITTPEGQGALSGLSDPELAAHLRVTARGAASWLSVMAGVRTGWGRSDAQRNGVRAEEHLQPGTGAAGALAGVAFSRLVGGDASVFGSIQARFNGRNSADYHYGKAFLANLGYEKRLAARLNGVLELNYRTAAEDEPSLGEKDPNTGGTVVYLAPRAWVRLERGLFLRLGVQVPVLKRLDGDQDEKVNVLTGLTIRF